MIERFFALVLLLTGCATSQDPPAPTTTPKPSTVFFMGNIIFDSTVTNEPPAIVTGNVIEADETTTKEK